LRQRVWICLVGLEILMLVGSLFWWS